MKLYSCELWTERSTGGSSLHTFCPLFLEFIACNLVTSASSLLPWSVSVNQREIQSLSWRVFYKIKHSRKQSVDLRPSGLCGSVDNHMPTCSFSFCSPNKATTIKHLRRIWSDFVCRLWMGAAFGMLGLFSIAWESASCCGLRLAGTKLTGKLYAQPLAITGACTWPILVGK